MGTHALVQEAVEFADLRLVVVDEQHRFGVAEREALANKGHAPHVLLMTATPIPRTLGQIVHADLDVSDLRTPPAGRQLIRTGVRSSDALVRRADGGPGALALIAREVAADHRAFVVVPLVEDDPESDVRSVEAGAKTDRGQLGRGNRGGRPGSAAAAHRHRPWPDAGVANETSGWSAFAVARHRYVVGTTVLEVGVDVPEATVMLILDADRFGLAQLHQLRGRVGRGEAAVVLRPRQ